MTKTVKFYSLGRVHCFFLFKAELAHYIFLPQFFAIVFEFLIILLNMLNVLDHWFLTLLTL